MIDLINEKQKQLEQLCRQYHVARLEIFGSATDQQAFDTQKSDLDFLVEFLPLRMDQYADTYFGLLFDLEKLFNRPVDLIMPNAVKNRFLLNTLNQQRKTIYAA